MNKAGILQHVTELQKLREKINGTMDCNALPIEHIQINFNEGLDRAVEAVLLLYAEIVLDEIQVENKREASTLL